MNEAHDLLENDDPRSTSQKCDGELMKRHNHHQMDINEVRPQFTVNGNTAQPLNYDHKEENPARSDRIDDPRNMVLNTLYHRTNYVLCLYGLCGRPPVENPTSKRVSTCFYLMDVGQNLGVQGTRKVDVFLHLRGRFVE